MADFEQAKDKVLDLLAGAPGDLMKIGLSCVLPSPVVAVFDSVRDQIKERNWKIFIKEYMDKSLNEKFDRDNQAHCEIVIHAVMKALDSSHEAKIVRISEMLSQALNNPEELRRAEDFINIISELSENEAICFGEIYREFAVHPSDEEDSDKDLKNYGEDVIKNMERDDRVYLLGRLAGKGLIRERTMSTWEYSGGDFYSTNMGKKLYQAIEATYKM